MFKGKFPLLLLLLLIKALIVGILVLFAGIGLSPDEAQYWTWSKELDWGYYSKPPGIAWQIAFGTSLFGDNEFGVRFGSLLLGSLLPIAVYCLAKSAKLSDSISFWAAVLMAFTPLGFLATFFAITDVGVVLFWTLCFIPLIFAIENDKPVNYLLIGFLIALGALFKWQIYWFWLLIVVLLFLYPSLRSRSFWGGLLISLIGLLPSLYWNLHHEWATFRHVGATFKGAETVAKGNFFEFFGAQAALVSPIIFILLLFSFKNLSKEKLSLKVLGGSCLAIVAIHCFFAIFKKMQGNWCDYAYPAGFVYLAWYCRQDQKLKWLQIGVVLSLLLTLFAFSLPTLKLRVNPFKHNMGWHQLDQALTKAGYQPENNFLFASSYQTTSILSFYNQQQKRAYFLNINGIRKNQFSFWPQMNEREVHKDGFFVLVESGKNAEEKLLQLAPSNLNMLQPFFKEVEIIGIFPLYTSKSALIIKGVQYNGLKPSSINHY